MKNLRRIALMLAGAVALYLTSGLPTATAQTDYRVGQIAVIEDINANILPAEGICDNLLFAQGLCVNHAATRFYETYPDNYDILVFFTPKALNGLFNVQMGFPVQIAAQGIGLEATSLFNPGQFGSAGRLRQCVKMGSLPALPNNPQDLGLMPQITGVELMAHEIGHQWMSWIMVDHGDERGPLPVLRGWENDAPNGHWSCWFNNHGSVMYGGNLTDNGDGTFTDHGGKRKYSQLDQYLMGLRTADEVDDMWYVDVDGTTEGCASMPTAPGGTWNHSGTRIDFPIEDIIRANGPRVPELDACHLKAGFVIFYESGLPPTPADIAKVDAYRTELEAWWPQGTDMRGSLDTRLDGCGTGTDTCSGETSSQCGNMPDGDAPDGDSDCSQGQTRCNGPQLAEICIGGVWEELATCELDEVCQDGACVSGADGDNPTDGDEPADGDDPDGDIPADGDDTKPDGDGAEPADGDDEASDGDLPGECTPGATACLNDVLKRCSSNGEAWLQVDDCGAQGLDCTLDGCVEGSAATGGGGCQSGALPASGLILLSLGLGMVVLRRREND